MFRFVSFRVRVRVLPGGRPAGQRPRRPRVSAAVTDLERAGLAAEVQPGAADPHVLGLYSLSLWQGHVPGDDNDDDGRRVVQRTAVYLASSSVCTSWPRDFFFGEVVCVYVPFVLGTGLHLSV